MWLFKRRKNQPKSARPGAACTFCRSTNTIVVSLHGSDVVNPVKTWRGQRYLTCRCLDCGQDFYAEAPPDGTQFETPEDERLIDNEEELKAAEEELKKEVEDEDDRMFK